jgi:hypothetical protein
MIPDHPLDKERCTHFLLIVLDIGGQETRSSTTRGLSLVHKLMRVDLSEPINELSLYVRGRWHVLDVVVSTSGFEIEFQSKTLRSTGAPGLTVSCEAPVESQEEWSKEGETGHAKVGTEPGDGSRVRLAVGLNCRSEGMSGEPSGIC